MKRIKEESGTFKESKEGKEEDEEKSRKVPLPRERDGRFG